LTYVRRFVISRLLQGALVILGATTIVFFLMRVLPGDPVRLVAPNANEASLEAIREQLGFNRPLPIQYLDFVGHAVTGDFGNSLYQAAPVTELILQKFPLTMTLGLIGLGLALAIAVPLGVLAALYRDTVWDRLVLLISMSALSMPNFWVGLVLIFFVAVRWGWLPATGYQGWKSFILPAIALATTLLAMLIRVTRTVVIDVINQDFVKAQRARGLPPSLILGRHVLKNTAIPILTLLGVQLGYLLGGALVIEYVFDFPGLGLLMFNAVFRRDYPLVQGISIVVAAVFVLINLAVDLSYAFLDPRIRQQELGQ
jgi:peptide/nickel transport system permease protein